MNKAARYNLLSSKLARRTLLLFILSSLIPIIVFSFLGSRQIEQLYTKKQQQELRQTAKNFGLILFERLSFLELHTAHLRSMLLQGDSKEISAAALDKFTSDEIAAVRLINSDDTARHFQLNSTVAENFYQHLSNVRTPALIVSNGKEPTLYFVYRPLQVDGKMLVSFQLSSEYMWRHLDNYDPRIKYSVRGSDGGLLFETRDDLDLHLTSTHKLVEGEGAAVWSLYLDARYAAGDWKISAFSTGADSVTDAQQFKTSIRYTTILAILLAALISTYVIRRTTAPIFALRKGIEQINQNRFGHLVDISSGDEFEALGNTFNGMSLRLHNYIFAMRSLAAIDRLILEKLKIEDVVRVVLVEGVELLHAKRLCFFVSSDDLSNPNDFYSFSEGCEISGGVITINNYDLYQLHHPQSIRKISDTAINRETFPFSSEADYIYTNVLWQNEKPKAILIAVFNSLPEDYVAGIASSFSDHVNVALANCNWEEKLFQQAHYDLLTGLPNRYRFRDKLKDTLEQAQGAKQQVALLLIDIDNFKKINDSFGQKTGDETLQRMANLLASAAGLERPLARIGANAFALIYIFPLNSRTTIVEETGALAERIRLAARTPLTLNNHKFSNTVTIGIALYPNDTESSETLLQCADEAMLEAKKYGKNHIYYYSEVYNTSALERARFTADINRALSNNEFELYYQPKVNLRTQKMDGCEALIRWNHPEKGLLTPYFFLPQAEEYGLIGELGIWVLREAARQKVEWQSHGVNPGRIAVNVSVLQLIDKDFARDVQRILAETLCKGEQLEFEITETAYVEDMDNFRVVISDLEKTGIVFSVDDYGTGYSSLSMILKLPVAKLKIDKSFVDGIPGNDISNYIVEYVIGMAKKIGITVIAEGVESTEQLGLLKQYKCDIIQGYIFSLPVPATKLVEMLEDNAFAAQFSSLQALLSEKLSD